LVKVRDCLSMQLSLVESERCIELANSLESLSADQVGEILRLCSGREKVPAQ
jgi:hypothetical protein